MKYRLLAILIRRANALPNWIFYPTARFLCRWCRIEFIDKRESK